MPAHLGDSPLPAVQVAVGERERVLEALFGVAGGVAGGGALFGVASKVLGGGVRRRLSRGIEHQRLRGAAADRLDRLDPLDRLERRPSL